MKLTLEQAIDRCIDRCNLDPEGDSMEIYKYMYQYKVIRDLPEKEFDKVYDQIAKALGFTR